MSCDVVAGLLAAGYLPPRDSGYPCIARKQADVSNADRATAQTVAWICELINESVPAPAVQAFARGAVRTWRGGPLYRAANPDDQRMRACSVWFAVKSAMHFVEHADQIRALLNESDQLQLLIRPDVLLSSAHPAGDCAVYAPLVCACLGALGIAWEIITVACDPREPDVYSHVYARAVLDSGQRIPLDASHGKYPGWEVPREHTLRKQVWDESGTPIDDVAPARPLGQYRTVPRVWPRTLGLGQILDATGTDIGATVGEDLSTNPALVIPPPAPTPTTGFNWDQALAGFLGQGINLAGKVVAPTTTIVRGPGGQLFYQTPAGSQTPLTAGTLLTSGGSNWLLIGGAVIAGVLVLSAMKGRR